MNAESYLYENRHRLESARIPHNSEVFPFIGGKSRMGCCHIYEVNNAFAIGKFIVWPDNDEDGRPSTTIRRRASTGQLNCCHSVFLCRFQYGFIACTHHKEDRRAMAYTKTEKR